MTEDLFQQPQSTAEINEQVLSLFAYVHSLAAHLHRSGAFNARLVVDDLRTLASFPQSPGFSVALEHHAKYLESALKDRDDN
jgi:hypothetical protein